jgi:hypothetical protein
MLTVSYGTIAQNRSQILSHVVDAKSINNQFRVIDIGGTAGGGWTNNIADMVIDINAQSTDKSMSIDICDESAWDVLLAHVQEHGMYDYAICTHTLEDIYNPVTALKYLPKIARRGVITMPSINTELSRVEHLNWIGYIHHRWIFDSQDGKMLLIPKLSVLESLFRNIRFKKSLEEVRFDWSDEIPYAMFMDNYLGPNASTVIDTYKRLIEDSICAK